MALIVCLECRKEVSDKARKCPHCGAPIGSGASSGYLGAYASPKKKSAAIRLVKYVLLIAVLGGAWWIWQAVTSNKKAPLSAGLTAVFREPRKVADTRVDLNEGQHVSYAFGLETESRVSVRVTAKGDTVDVMLMPKPEAEMFRNAGGNLFGGGYSCLEALSSSQAAWLDKTEVVPKGEWSLVVMRPKKASPGKEGVPVEIAVTVY